MSNYNIKFESLFYGFSLECYNGILLNFYEFVTFGEKLFGKGTWLLLIFGENI